MNEEVKGGKTSKIDLTTIPLGEIKKEILRRERLENERVSTSYEKKKINEWKKRPPCLLIGRAYGLESTPSESDLFSVYIKGNSGRTYKPKFFVAPSVVTYFHNSFTFEHEKMLQNMLNVLCEYFINAYIDTSLDATIKLIELSKNFGSSYNISPKTKKIIEAGFEEAAIEKLCEFPLDELEKFAKETYIHSHEKLIKKAIDHKIKNNVPDRQRIELPKEYKTVLALNKLKDNS